MTQITLPGPTSNAERALRHPLLAVGDYTDGAAEDMFTTAEPHGMTDGYQVWLLLKTAEGVVGADVQSVLVVERLTDTTFQLRSSHGGPLVENTADGTAVFLITEYPGPDYE